MNTNTHYPLTYEGLLQWHKNDQINRSSSEEKDCEFFALHPQPPLYSAAFWAQDALLNQSDGDSENEEDIEDEEGISFNNPCSDVCSCIRYFATAVAEPEPLEPDTIEDFSNFFENCAYDSLLPPISPGEFEEEAEDQSLYDPKRNTTYEAFVQQKVRKTFDENDNIPMDISDDENEENEEEEDMLSIMSDISVDCNEDVCIHGIRIKNEICDDCEWLLEQNAHNQGLILSMILPIPCLQRANTQWVDPVTGEIVYNGNPNGSKT